MGLNKWLYRNKLIQLYCPRCLEKKEECVCRIEEKTTNLEEIVSGLLIGSEIFAQVSFQDPIHKMHLLVRQRMRIERCEFVEGQYNPDKKKLFGKIVGGKWDGVECSFIITWKTDITI